MVTRASCIVYHQFTHHPFRTKIKWRLPIPISEKHYKLITWFLGGKSSKVFVMGICCSNPTAWCRRIPESYPPVHRKPWVVGTKMPRARDLPGHLRPASFFSSEVNHRWKEAPTASFTCEKRKGKQKLLMLYLLSYIQSLNAIGEKNDLYDLMLLDFMSFNSWSSLASSLGIWHRGELCLESKSSLKSLAVVELRMEIDYRRS